jgi:hypothetical protein
LTSAKKRLERAFIASLGHILAQSADGLIQRFYLIHFSNRPRPFLTMPSHHWVSVAIDTKGDASVLKPLLVVMGFAWWWCFAN